MKLKSQRFCSTRILYNFSLKRKNAIASTMHQCPTGRRYYLTVYQFFVYYALIPIMRRRLEKYYLFCNSTFLGLFTFVRYIYLCNKIHSKLEQKKPAKYIVNFRYISEVYDIYLRLNTL